MIMEDSREREGGNKASANRSDPLVCGRRWKNKSMSNKTGERGYIYSGVGIPAHFSDVSRFSPCRYHVANFHYIPGHDVTSAPAIAFLIPKRFAFV